MMLAKSSFSKLDAILAALLIGIVMVSDRAPAQNYPATPNKIKPQTQSAIATLANGNYQFCSQPDANDWRDGVGVCFNFAKVGNHVEGYYGYPHSDNFICVKGEVNGNFITGEALAISWADHQWLNIPKSTFQWDSEGRLTLSQGNIVRTANDEAGRIDWILFRSAALNASGFYRYSTPRMTPPSQLCHWNSRY
jgi:hypothetical protein